MKTERIAVLGGTGFLGRRVVKRLLARGFVVRSAARHPRTPRGATGTLELVRAEIHDEASLAAALRDCNGAVNATSLYAEHGQETFRSVHVEGARRVAALARKAGITRLVHLSGIGADTNSPSLYIRSRGLGETAVREAFPGAIIVRPSAMIGPDDALLTPLAGMLKWTPVFPLFGRGETMLQPVHVGDVAETIARLFARSDNSGATFELAGPGVVSYRQLVQAIAARLHRRVVLLPVPFPIWHVAATLAELHPNPPITRNQVDLMQRNNMASGREPDFDAVGIRPRSLADALSQAI